MRANIYKANITQSQRCTVKTELWMLFFLIFSLAALGVTWYHTEEDLCDPANAGTDYWYEVCMNEGEIDLGADQAQDKEDR